MEGRVAPFSGRIQANARPGWRRAWQLAAVVTLALLPYLNALQADFTFDDAPAILNNPGVVHGLDLGWIFASAAFGKALYRPVTVGTYAANFATTSRRPDFFHATNMLLHAAVSVLVFLLAERLFGTAAIALPAAVVFAVHPIHTEAVTSIVGRAEVLAACFALLAILAALWAEAKASPTVRACWGVLSTVSFLLAVLSKESAATVLPLVCYARMIARGDPFWRGVRREFRAGHWLGYVAALVVALGLRRLALGSVAVIPMSRLDNILGFVPWPDRVRSAIAIVWDYFGLLNVPLALSADYSYDQVPVVHAWIEARCLAGAALVAASLLAIVRHPQPAVRFAVALSVVTLALTANVFFPIGTVKAERLLYLPSVGWALLVGVGFAALRREPRYRRLAAAGLAAMVLVFAFLTWQRNQDWKDDIALYASMIESAPRSAKAHNNYGYILERHGRDAEAVEQFRAALAIYPQADQAALGIAIAQERHGQVDEALHSLDDALAINPEFVLAHVYRCVAYFHAGNHAAAAAACRAGLRVEPANADLLKGLGLALVGSGDLRGGHAVLRRALALNPEDEEARNELARADETPADAARAPGD